MNPEKIPDLIKTPNFFRELISKIIPGLLFFILGFYLNNEFLVRSMKSTSFNVWVKASIILTISYAFGKCAFMIGKFIIDIPYFVEDIQDEWKEKKKWNIIIAETFYGLYGTITHKESDYKQYSRIDLFDVCHINPLVGNEYERKLSSLAFNESMIGISMISALFYQQKFLAFTFLFFWFFAQFEQGRLSKLEKNMFYSLKRKEKQLLQRND